jgi:hypothetical protein
VIVPTPVIFAATAMVLFGFADFALKRASDMGVKPHHSVMVQAWFFSSSILTYSLLTGTFVPTPAALWGSAAGLFMIVGYTAFVRSLTGEPVSIQARHGAIDSCELVCPELSAPTGQLNVDAPPTT